MSDHQARLRAVFRRHVILGIAASIALILPMLAHATAQAAPSTVTALNHRIKPVVAADPDRSGVQLGLKLRTSKAGTITAMQFYRSRAQKAAYTGTIWNASGAKLGTARFSASKNVGWQTAKLKKPIRIAARQTIVASYYAPNGSYAATNSAFTKSSKHNGITIPANGGVYRYGRSGGFPIQSWRGSNYFVDVIFRPGASSGSPTSTRPTRPSAPASSGKPTASTGFPSAANTGVPAGTSLSKYTGPCTITKPGTVIDSKSVDCSLTIRAKGVVISRSRINGTIANDSSSTSFTIRDSEVSIGDVPGTGIGNVNYVAQRVRVTGGNRSMNCDDNCTIEDSYVHGQFRDSTGLAHESGIRMSENTVLRHNTIACDAPDVPPDAGCSAALTGYGDFAVVQSNLIEGNLFKATTGGYCAYGGSTTGKTFSSGVKNIRFIDNVFERGKSGQCGVWGAVTSFDSSASGNTWRGNMWSDGATVPPAN